MSNHIKVYILFFTLSFVGIDVHAQSNFEKLQNTTLQYSPNKKQKQSKQKGKPQQDQIELNINDSLFKAFDVDIDLTLGETSSDLSWGDPVKNPRIRCNKASNLYGPVRHYADGSIRWHRGFDYYAPKGTPVCSVGNGVVSLIQNHPDYGLCVLITHKRPKATYYSFYAHLSSVSVNNASRSIRSYSPRSIVLSHSLTAFRSAFMIITSFLWYTCCLSQNGFYFIFCISQLFHTTIWVFFVHILILRAALFINYNFMRLVGDSGSRDFPLIKPIAAGV